MTDNIVSAWIGVYQQQFDEMMRLLQETKDDDEIDIYEEEIRVMWKKVKTNVHLEIFDITRSIELLVVPPNHRHTVAMRRLRREVHNELENAEWKLGEDHDKLLRAFDDFVKLIYKEQDPDYWVAEVPSREVVLATFKSAHDEFLQTAKLVVAKIIVQLGRHTVREQ